MTYCDELVNNASAANAVFPGINFNALPAMNLATKGSSDQELVIQPLLSRLMGVKYDISGSVTSSLSTMPSESVIHDQLATLMHDLAGLTSECSATSCLASRTKQIIKATCTASMSSAPMMLH